MIPEELRRDLERLEASGLDPEAIEDGSRAYVRFCRYRLPGSIYNKPLTNLLVLTLSSYPKAGLDMFWTDHDLTLPDGSAPNGASVIEEHIGLWWRRFSYHPYQNKPWNPSSDSIVSFMSYIEQRLKRGD